MKYQFLLLFALTISTVFSCTSENKKTEDTEIQLLEKPSIEVSENDTIAVTNLVNEYVQCLTKQEYNTAVSMLHFVEDGIVYPLTDSIANEYIKHYEMNPIYACKVQGFTFRSNLNNSVTLIAQIIETGDIDRNLGVTRLYLNPVLYQGEWYLTLLDKNAEGVKDIYTSEE